MMRWKRGVIGLAVVLAAISGCKQQCFLFECDADHYFHDVGLPERVVCDPSSYTQPVTVTTPPPSTVNDAERPPRYLSLAEAVAIALEQGKLSAITGGAFLPTSPFPSAGAFQDPLAPTGFIQFGGNPAGESNSIRVLRMEPAKVGTDIEFALSKFDAQWVTNMTWSNTDNASAGTFINQFQPNGESAAFSTSLAKPLPTGGVAGITFDTTYRLLSIPQAGIPNPSYNTDLTFRFEQPLLQGYGIEINQLRAAHPGSIQGLTTNYAAQTEPLAGTTPGILIARTRFDEARAEFELQVHLMILNVKTEYWNLYSAYWALYSAEQALRQAFEAWKINKARFEAGRIAIQDFAQTRQQYELFRSERLAALANVLEAERALRDVLALPVEDCTRLVPIDEPVLVPYQPDWCTALNEALALRPPLIAQREELRASLFTLMLQKNYLLPDLRLLASYGLNGIGSRLDGPIASDPNNVDVNALRNLASDRFTNYSLGLRMAVPLGYRGQHAVLRKARLQLAQQYMLLRDFEEKTQHLLVIAYRSLFETHAQIQINRSQRIAAAEQLEARFKQFLAGQGTLDILLESQRVWATALQAEYSAVGAYNVALARFEYAKGTILQDENIHIAEGPLPCCAQERAVEHLKERTKALVLHQRPDPGLGSCCGSGDGPAAVPQVPANTAPPVSTLPFLQQNPPSLPAPEKLPLPRPASAGSATEQSLKTLPPIGTQGSNSTAVPDAGNLRIAPFPIESTGSNLIGTSTAPLPVQDAANSSRVGTASSPTVPSSR
jgi:outer membrane protein TolC